MTQLVRTQPSPNCFLCGTTGQPLYTGCVDGLYEAPGVWQINRCPQEGCGLLWLDPMPEERDLPLIYENYYTHADRPALNRGFRRSVIHFFYRAVLWLTGLTYQRAQWQSFYLRDMQPGRLLDVGCGEGGQLARLRTMGWQVEGQEVDAKAAEQARTRHGLHVHVGPLRELGLPDSSFDVVTMSHVIEHAHDPIGLLKDCHRILKPGGILVAITPNSDSLGHSRFGSSWAGLDPPRHLHVFSPTTIQKLGTQAGFQRATTWTTAANAQLLAEVSIGISRHAPHNPGSRPRLQSVIRGLVFQLQATVHHWMHPDFGDECILRAIK